MSHHWSSILKVADWSYDELHRGFKKCRDKVHVKGAFIHDVRELTLLIRSKEAVLRRVFVHEVDSGGLRDVGWIVNGGLTFCLVCASPFAALTWRHHCRACGLVACSSCTSSTAYIEGFEHCGRQRVCHNCNPKMLRTVQLVPDKEWGASIADILLDASGGRVKPHDAATFHVSKKPLVPHLGNFFIVVCHHSSHTLFLVPDLWKYGPVSIRQVHPRYVFLAVRKDRRMFVNVCTCERVPLAAAGETAMFVVGSRGRTAEGLTVYDVAVSQNAIKSIDGQEQDIRRVLRVCHLSFALMFSTYSTRSARTA
jgi:hypothetical protein